jgi:uncharacterized membrane protein YoaK (UPF0700 family)
MGKKESFEPLDILVRHRIKTQMVGYVMCGGVILAGLLSWQFMSWHIFIGFIILMALILLVYTHRAKQKIQKKIQDENKRNLEKILKDLQG